MITQGHYKRVHKGGVVLALSSRHISDQCETQVWGKSRMAITLLVRWPRPPLWLQSASAGGEAHPAAGWGWLAAPHHHRPAAFAVPQGMPLDPGYMVAYNYGSVRCTALCYAALLCYCVALKSWPLIVVALRSWQAHPSVSRPRCGLCWKLHTQCVLQHLIALMPRPYTPHALSVGGVLQRRPQDAAPPPGHCT